MKVSVKEIEVSKGLLRKYGIDDLENLLVSSFTKSEKAGKKFNENKFRSTNSDKVTCLVLKMELLV